MGHKTTTGYLIAKFILRSVKTGKHDVSLSSQYTALKILAASDFIIVQLNQVLYK